MTLPANAQAHLLSAFQSRIPTDHLIPPETRYRMYAEKVVHRPLSDLQALSLEEARVVLGRLRLEQRLPTSIPPWIALPEPEPVAAPALFTPGRPLPLSTRALTPDRLYGVAVPGDWITVIRRKDRLDWRAMCSGELGSGNRKGLDLYLQHLGGAA